MGNEMVVGYIRVSTTEQGVSGAGLDAQRAAIVEECARRRWPLLRVEEDVLTGGTMRRPGLQAALDACRTGAAGAIMVARLDRLTRSLVDFAGLLEEARTKGYTVVGLDLGVDTSTPSGEMMASVLAVFAQFERRLASQRTKEALAVKKAQGVRIGRPRQVPAEIATRIKRARSRGRTYAQIAEKLNTDGIPTAHSGDRWHAATVRSIALRH